jgi:hypothetical protein
VVVKGLPGLLGQFKSNRPPALSLAHARPINGVAVGCNVIDLDRNNVTTSELAVDRKIE